MAVVRAVSRNGEYSFSKPNRDEIVLVPGLGVDGDVHAGVTVRHRSRVKADPSQPNLRQVHLISGELFDEVLAAGYAVAPGQLGENVTTEGVDLLGLPRGTVLRFGQAGEATGHGDGGPRDETGLGAEAAAGLRARGEAGLDAGAAAGLRARGEAGLDAGAAAGLRARGEAGLDAGAEAVLRAAELAELEPAVAAAVRALAAAVEREHLVERKRLVAGERERLVAGERERLVAGERERLVDGERAQDVGAGDRRPAVVITGLRNPCLQIDRFRDGLLKEVAFKGDDGIFVRRAGVMAVVLRGGVVRPGAAVEVELPPGEHERLDRV